MQSKLGLVALSVIASLVLFGGNTVEAKSETTDKKKQEIIKVKAGDTLESIAKKYDTTYVRLFNANKKIDNPDVIDVGDKIRIPTKKEKLKDRQIVAPAIVSALPTAQAAPAAPTASYVPSTQPRGSSAGNTYAYGYCTWYVKNQRPDLPNMLGNGGQWVANAAARGLSTGSTPRVGAVAEEPGHVAYVEAVKGNMITISEMNYGGGWNQVHRRTVPASNYRYIY